MIITRGPEPVRHGRQRAGHRSCFSRLASWPDFSTHYGPVFTGLSAARPGSGPAIRSEPRWRSRAWPSRAACFDRPVERDGAGQAGPPAATGLCCCSSPGSSSALLDPVGSGHNEMVMIGLALLGVLQVRRETPTTWASRPAAGVDPTSSGSPPRARRPGGAVGPPRHHGARPTGAQRRPGCSPSRSVSPPRSTPPFWTGLRSVSATPRRLMLEAGRTATPSKAGAVRRSTSSCSPPSW